MAEEQGFLIDVPQYGIVVQPNPYLKNKSFLGMQIMTSTGMIQFYMWDTSNYEQFAREIHKQIMDAGVAARRAEKGIVVADAPLPKAQGRQQRGQGGSRPQGS